MFYKRQLINILLELNSTDYKYKDLLEVPDTYLEHLIDLNRGIK